MSEIGPDAVKPLLTAGGEIAFIDVREAGQFGEGHPFFAINIPYSKLELRAERLIPRMDVPVVVMDEGDDSGLSDMARRRLEAMGYSDVKVMSGGARGWARHGFTLYKGVNLPSKAFGELVEHASGTPHVSARQLHEMQEKGEAHILLDGRTPGEYRRMTIPGSRLCPNGELGYRLPALLKDKKTPIVVNCAGRTRSIIGAQSLINLGVENPVYALENGTQGWELAGLTLNKGNEPSPMAEMDDKTIKETVAQADSLIEKYAIPVIGQDALTDWQADKAHALYLFDVRTLEEYETAHLPGAVHAPGGQLVQATDLWVAVRGARIVLCDDTSLRAAQAALWLRRMGHDAYVLREDITQMEKLDSGPQDGVRMSPTMEECKASQLTVRLSKGAVLLDLRPSMAFREGHIKDARWAIRPGLGRLELNREDEIILTGGRNTCELAAMDLRDFGCKSISFLDGGPEEWKASGLEIVETPNEPADENCIDYLFFVHDRHTGNLEAAQGYIDWELALVGQMDDQERGVFSPEF